MGFHLSLLGRYGVRIAGLAGVGRGVGRGICTRVDGWHALAHVSPEYTGCTEGL